MKTIHLSLRFRWIINETETNNVFYTRKDKDFPENKEGRMERSKVMDISNSGFINNSSSKLMFYLNYIHSSVIKKRQSMLFWEKHCSLFKWGNIITHITHFLDEHHTILIMCYFELKFVNTHYELAPWVTEFCQHWNNWQLIQHNRIKLYMY